MHPYTEDYVDDMQRSINKMNTEPVIDTGGVLLSYGVGLMLGSPIVGLFAGIFWVKVTLVCAVLCFINAYLVRRYK